MQLKALTCLALLSASIGAFSVGGPHGSYNDIVKRDSLLAAANHRRHHAKRASKCKASSNSSNSTTSGSSSVSKKKAASSSKSINGSSNSAGGSSSQSGNSGSSSSSSSSSSSGSSNSSTSSTSSSSSADLDGITGFLGTNTGIGSWFRTDNSQDDTNGRSWCQLNYQDDWLGFAPDVSTMLSNFGDDTTKAGTAYCGLEAKATNPNNGNTALIYIVDGFDPTWVRTPGSIDLTLGAFKALYGSTTDDKDIVIQNLQWEFTGNRKSQYEFNAGS